MEETVLGFLVVAAHGGIGLVPERLHRRLWRLGGSQGARPISDISRIMSKAIPENGRISRDAKEFMQKCVSNFNSFVTIEASNKCQREKRKIINGDDLVWAMAALGCDEYVQPLRFNLQLYREYNGM